MAGSMLSVALLTLTAVQAPTAHADAIVDNYISTLQGNGINFPSQQAALVAAHQVCDELDAGIAPSDVANDVMNRTNLDGYHAGFFVGIAVASFCPNHAGQT